MSTKHEHVPEWAMEIFQRRLEEVDFDFNFGLYYMYAAHPDPESTEMWRACIHADVLDTWDNERDPTKQRDPITLDEFSIERL